MSYAEITALSELLVALLFNGRTGVLMLLLACAAVFDFRSHRIPNWLVFSGALFGVIYNTVLPPWPHGTIFFPLAGLGLGLLLFLPLYLLRAMGAGDVKLLAMVGAFLGPDDTFRVALASMIVGGVLAILFVLVRGTALRLLRNLTAMFKVAFLDVLGGSVPSMRISASASAGKLPYGIAIALGATGYLVLRQLGFL